MFKKTKAKSAQQNGSRESVASTGNLSGSSNENLSKDGKETIDKMLHLKTPFDVYFLGMVQEINMGNSRKRDTEALLIDQVEEAQIEGKLPISAREEDKVVISLSKHGLKVLDTSRQEVLQRHPLYMIAQVIQYEDGFGKPNIAFKIGQLQVSKGIFQCYVFQCSNEEQAQAICQCVRRIFDVITVKP